ncbi:MAG: DNA-deoxyinosine glycosylase [Alphaproteobacteria bacterium]|nr:DNA-deoxyinosine glycosylase [Alphaproteobacteria bacterium]
MPKQKAPRLASFPPVADDRAHTLILGTMPGAKSLEAGEYYAHPRNQFWRMMGALYGAGPELAYQERLAILKENGVALWDVLKHCEREGSLDSAIKDPRPNDFAGFFGEYPDIKRIVFGGQKAQTLFNRLVAPHLEEVRPTFCVPSPSPAHTMNINEKLEKWQKILE